MTTLSDALIHEVLDLWANDAENLDCQPVPRVHA
jgi:hypothetical protein